MLAPQQAGRKACGVRCTATRLAEGEAAALAPRRPLVRHSVRCSASRPPNPLQPSPLGFPHPACRDSRCGSRRLATRHSADLQSSLAPQPVVPVRDLCRWVSMD
eukprot:scaffold106759_cov63-Phaeocystis_antarctica.AAC.1